MYLRSLFEKLFIDGIQLITKLKSNMNYNYNVSSTNSKQSELCIYRSRNIDARLLCKAAVCCNCTQEVGNKIIKATVS